VLFIVKGVAIIQFIVSVGSYLGFSFTKLKVSLVSS